MRAILATPRYMGRQVWNRQRKDEVLLDINDVAFGDVIKMALNDDSKWIYCDQIMHPPVSTATASSFLNAAGTMGG